MRLSQTADSFKLRALTVAVISYFATSSALAANSGDATVVRGGATFSTTGSTLTVTNTPNAIINWARFGIDAGETVRFVQQSSASAVLNRVTGSDPSHILGALQSNGKVYLINPNGIMFGANARIDVNGLVASTLNLSDADFLAGKLNFNADRATPGSVVNAGQISTPNGGFVYLLAPNVENSGIITTPSGEAILAAGNSIEIVDSTDPSQRVLVSATSQDINLSSLMTQGSGNIFTVLNSGKASANTVVQDQTGKIYFKSVNKTLVTGTAEAHGNVGKGGQVQVLGDVVGVYEHAVIDASGRDGGGTVLVGGDYQGKNANVQNATVTYFGPNAQIHADAVENGDGGKVILWADDTTRAYGHITARGGSVGGDGGFIETSGHYFLDVTRAADASASNGQGGTWLLDPTDISIVHGSTDSNIYGGPAFTASGPVAASVISDNTLNSAINGGTSVSISTSSAGGGDGDIIFDGLTNGAVVLNKSSGATFATTLTLNADRDIRFKGSTTIENSSSSYGFSVVMNAGASGAIKSDSSDSANLTLNSTGGSMYLQVNGGKTWDNSGTLSLLGASQIDLHDGSNAATFNNTGTVYITNNTSNWAFYSESTNNSGIINNSGLFSISGSSGISFEALFNNSSTGEVDISLSGNQPLSLQNAGTLSGIFSIDSGAKLWISDVHAGARTFSNAVISNNGTILLDVQTTFDNTYLLNEGTLTVNASSIFNDSSIGASGDLTVVTNNLTYTGINSFSAGGDLTISGNLVSSSDFVFGSGGSINFDSGASVNVDMLEAIAHGNINFNGASSVEASSLLLFAGGDINIVETPVSALDLLIVEATNMNIVGGSVSADYASLSASGFMEVMLTGNLTLEGGSDPYATAKFYGSPDVGSSEYPGITVGGAIYMITGDTGAAATINSYSGGSIHVNFPYLSSGGYFVDGVEGMVYNGTSGFVVGGYPAVLDTNLFITYGGLGLTNSVLNSMLNDLLGASDIATLIDDAIVASTATEGDLMGTDQDDSENKEDKPQQCSA